MKGSYKILGSNLEFYIEFLRIKIHPDQIMMTQMPLNTKKYLLTLPKIIKINFLSESNHNINQRYSIKTFF